MFAATYTLVRVEPSLAVVTDPKHRSKAKTYTALRFARSARSQSDFVRGDGWAYRILETVIYSDGHIASTWVD